MAVLENLHLYVDLIICILIPFILYNSGARSQGLHITHLHICILYIRLNELYTSETTLAEKIVLTLLNNEFVLKI